MSRIGIFPIRPDRTRTGCPVRIRVRPDRIPDCPVRLKNPAGPDRIHGKIDKKWGSKNHHSLSLRIFIFLKIFQSKKDRLCWTIHQDSKEISENFISKVFFIIFTNVWPALQWSRHGHLYTRTCKPKPRKKFGGRLSKFGVSQKRLEKIDFFLRRNLDVHVLYWSQSFFCRCPSSGPPWAALFVARSLLTKSDHEIETWCWYHLIGLFNTKKSSLEPKSYLL